MKPLFLIDLTDNPIFSEKEFIKMIVNYPDGAMVLVTREQKMEIAGFSGNSTRFIDGLKGPLSLSKDILTYDGTENHVYIVTGRDLDARAPKKFLIF